MIEQEGATDWSPEDTVEEVVEHAENADGFESLREQGGDSLFERLKLVGLYHQKQEGSFMFRTKIPGGQLTSEQARVVGEVAEEYAVGPEPNPVYGESFLDLTTRQDTQMHWLEIRDMPDVWSRYDDVDLTSMQACGNSVRNVVGCPAAGLHGGDLDVQDVVEDITEFFVGYDRYANLPRKLKVSVTGCGHDCAEADINDLGFTPAERDGRTGFNVRIGGGLSDAPRFARSLDLFVEPDDAVEVVRATAEVFVELGSYPDAAVNRLRFLVEEHGVDRIRREIQEEADVEFEPAGRQVAEGHQRDHVGVHEQSDGRRYLGLSVTAGRLSGDDLHEAAELADEYGEAEVRLTTSQNLVIPHVEADEVDDLLDEPLLDRHPVDPGPFSRGAVTCTGREFCSYGVVETKNRTKRVAEELDGDLSEATDEDVFGVRFSGCKASCAQPQIGDVGLRGATYRDDDETKEAVDVGVGGSLDDPPAFADWIEGRVPLEDLQDVVRRLVTEYESSGYDSFGEYCRETSRDRLRQAVRGTEVEA